jgi:hypothetical protein
MPKSYAVSQPTMEPPVQKLIVAVGEVLCWLASCTCFLKRSLALADVLWRHLSSFAISLFKYIVEVEH